MTANIPPREPWMTAELEAKLREKAVGGIITCTQVQEFAQENNIEITRMKPFVDIAGLKVKDCQKLCV